MATMERPKSMSELPAQHPIGPASAAEARARFFNSGNAFNIKLPAVPNAVFTDEPARAPARGLSRRWARESRSPTPPKRACR